MWLTDTIRVRGPIASDDLVRLDVDEPRPTNSQVRMTAPYSCRVVSTSSPGESRSERMTAFSPEVAFGTNTRSSARAPTNAASAPRASAMSESNRRPRNSTGFRSSSSWSAW